MMNIAHIVYEMFMMYLAGEALVGDGAEVSHIDLLIGDK